MNNNDDDLLDRLITLEEAAHLLHLHRKTIERYAREGRIPCYRVGNKVMLDRGDVLQWLAERRADHCHD